MSWSENVIFEQRPEGNEEENHMEILGKKVTAVKKSRCKRPGL